MIHALCTVTDSGNWRITGLVVFYLSVHNCLTHKLPV